ncbi:MAG: ribose 5-phosphate isomerase B [Candidatus Marinimicrobia bacterium]|nr:ribose 5-phosphate isomerase B [Candidatus Neomarinimicrobiota bacterium]
MDQKNSKSKIIFLGADHAGYDAKNFALDHIKGLGIDAIDLGTFSKKSIDYPEIAFKVARKVAESNDHYGILFCGTGIGMSICANKVKNIRAALCTTEIHVEMARKHNNANILAIGGRISSREMIKKMIDKWFATEFEGGRHQRRINKIKKYSEC